MDVSIERRADTPASWTRPYSSRIPVAAHLAA